MTTIQPRGIRNNNPGNIRYNGTPWTGLDNPPTDGAFCRFKEARYGIRALARVLRTYGSKYNLNTVKEIIGRFAPPFENDTQSYIRAVCSAAECRPDEEIALEQKLVAICRAIIRHENGACPYSDDEIKRGVEA